VLKATLSLLILLFISSLSVAQSPIIGCSDSTFCVPAVMGMPRTKGLVIKQERVMNYNITSSSSDPELNNSTEQVDRNRRWSFKIKAPIVNKPHLKVAAGLNYYTEEYTFENTAALTHPLYVKLEDKPLRNLGASIYVAKPFLGNKFMLFRGGLNLNGDFNDPGAKAVDYMKFSFAVFYGVKRNHLTSFAIGASYTYTFGRALILPLFSFNKTLNNKWGIESILPINVRLRFVPTEKNRFYLSTEMNGANYNINIGATSISNQETLYLEKSELRYLLTYEREIHDWLWFGLEAGMRQNLNFGLSESFHIVRKDQVLQNNLKEAFVFGASIFIVPPRKMLLKH
jgi:hypothetical protein